MKNFISIISLFIICSCSSTRFVDSWKNPEIITFNPEKVMVVGITNNLTARKIFEEELSHAFMNRNINAIQSTSILNDNFTSSRKSEEEINNFVQKISKQGFDAVVITSVKGVEKKRNYYNNYHTFGVRWARFGKYYYLYQDIYYNPNYYEEYKVYHVETSIYNINEEDGKSLVWVGALDLVNPRTITPTVNDYVSRIIKQLEHEKIIKKLQY